MGASRKGLIFGFLLLPLMLFSQDADQSITIAFQDEPLLDALAKLDQATDRQLSFNPLILPQDLRINQTFESRELDEILSAMLGAGYEFKDVSSYTIIQKKQQKKQKKRENISESGNRAGFQPMSLSYCQDRALVNWLNFISLFEMYWTSPGSSTPSMWSSITGP